MTGFAFSLVRAFCELAAMRVRFVAVRALAERQRFFEIGVGMASRAANLGMLTQQRILGA